MQVAAARANSQGKTAYCGGDAGGAELGPLGATLVWGSPEALAGAGAGAATGGFAAAAAAAGGLAAAAAAGGFAGAASAAFGGGSGSGLSEFELR